MNNNIFDEFTNQNYKELSNWLNNLDPYGFSLYGVIAAYLISIPLTANQKNSIGNWFEEIGQIMLTISAQEITYKQSKQNNKTSYGYEDNFKN